MRFGTRLSLLGLAVIGLAGCETVDDRYYDAPRHYRTYEEPRVYRDPGYYRYSERRIPPPYVRDDRRGWYDGDRSDGGRGRYDRSRDDDGGRDRGRRDGPDRNQNPPPRQANSAPPPPRAYTPPQRESGLDPHPPRREGNSNPDLYRCTPDPSRGTRGNCPTQ